VGERLFNLADDLARAHHQLETAAIYDAQTGLLNRNAFYRQASGELERARRSSLPISLIALDIDNFKSLNSTHGTSAGDAALKIIGQTICEKSRPYDCIGRWSGDEFLIALPGVVGPDAERIAERILAGIHAERIEVGHGKLLDIALSAGVVCAARINTAAELDPLIEQSRQAMSRAREAGGDQVHQIYL
jgi:diguanylate cyclase (GGDEF)-like protein